MVNFTKQLFAPIVLVATILFGSNVSAQDYYTNSKSGSSLDDKNFRLGLSVNPNIGWYRYNDDTYESSAKVGLSYGLLADLGFARNYYFSTGLLINSISSKVTYPEGTANPGTRDLVRLQYVDIPLTVKLKSEENEMGRFYGQFGFTTGFKVSGKEKLPTTPDKKTSIDGTDLFRLGLQLGGGAEWKMSDNLSLLTGLSFNNGFTRAIKEGKPKTSFLALNVGVFF